MIWTLMIWPLSRRFPIRSAIGLSFDDSLETEPLGA